MPIGVVGIPIEAGDSQLLEHTHCRVIFLLRAILLKVYNQNYFFTV